MHNPVSSASGVRKSDIAVIGMSCRFPGASNYEEFWENLKAGKSGIEEVPANRWNWADYWGDPLTEKNKSNSKWGGFLKGVDHFDTDFFGMSVTEVERMDPQQRIMLELTWACLEDAGVRPATISGEQIGVFLGVFNFDYKEIQERGGQLTIEAHHSTGTASAIIANRVSYYFNFKGPSVPIDTACSSSLSAVHAAIQSLLLGECKMAVAGGINLLLTPTRHISFSKTGMLSPTGSCKSFDEGADGYVRGEGAGLVLLKPLEQALADKDNIYGIIKGSAVNHSGKTYSLTYPNPDAQKDVIITAQQMAGITPDTIGYIEAHGTGTPKGDPIEFRGLTSAFEAAGLGEKMSKNYCALGSVKSNVGHLEAAAGIAGIIKVLLSMRHQQLPALQNFKQLNHRISLTDTPFFLVTSLMPWEPLVNGDNQPLPRRAGVSSFGFGGTNAHVVLEEAPSVPQPATPESIHNKPPYYVVCLSAKTPENLADKEKELAAWLENRSQLIDIADVCRTLSAGREHFVNRTVLIVKDSQDLLEKLQALSVQSDIEGCFRNVSVNKEQEEVSALFSEIGKVITQALTAQDISEEEYYRKLAVLVELYLKGYNPDWEQPWFGNQGKRIGLPAYPFTKQGYWVPEPDEAKTLQPLLHPLLGSNTSDLRGQRFTTRFTGQEFFLRDHVVNDKRVLPAVAYLEMVRAAVVESTKSEGPQHTSLHLENMIWSQPIQVGEENVEVHTSLNIEGADAIAFSVFSEPDEQHEAARVYCKGAAVFKASAEPVLLDIERIKESCRQNTLLKEACYSGLQAMGFAYGPAHQCLEVVYSGPDLHLAKLILPATEINSFNQYVLHPGIMDAALQACLVTGLPFENSSALYLPFALDSMEIVQATTANMWAEIRPGKKEQSASVKRFDIDLCDAEGRLCVSIKGFTFRQLTGNTISQRSCLLLTPEWKEQTIVDQHHTTIYARRLVFLCEPGNSNVDRLQEQMPDVRFIVLQGASGNIGERYLDYTAAVFEEVKALLSDKLPGKTSVQVVIFQYNENAVLSGLHSLLKTAMLENPAFIGQLISVTNEEHIIDRLKENAFREADHRISYLDGSRKVGGWKEITTTAAGKPLPWKKDAVYLITGGTGGLGMIFAKEIAGKVSNPLLLLTGRSALTATKETQLNELRTLGARVEYHQVDVGNKNALAELIQYARSNYAGLQGIIHSAGIVQDDYIIRKRPESIREVLSPKVLGTTYLDELTHDLSLDFFVLFSSVVAPLGNPAQADYAAANAYLDEYAAWRNQLVAAKKRQGHTISINWPLWKQGGMQLGKEMEAMLLQQMGMSLLETADGIESLYKAMAAGVSQIMVAPGNREVLKEKFLTATDANSVLPDDVQDVLADGVPEEAAIEYFKELLSVTIKRPVQKIDAAAAMEAYGIDSIMVMQMTNQLETVFGTLPKTLFFEYQNIKELTQYFLDHYQEKLRQVLLPATTVVNEQPAVSLPHRKPAFVPEVQAVHDVQPEKVARPAASHSGALDIAIIGVAGRYPQADNLQEFWNNLQQGKDCITEIPRDRWDYRLYFDADKEKEGKTYSKWGGFINDVDKFDPLFFNISPSEAERMDPQERLFLQCVYEAMEDAGYTKQSLTDKKNFGLGNQVGVYVGVMYEEYQLYGAQEALHGRPVALWGLPSSIANRVSYFFDFHGPSMAIDTMCSSSLTAIHLACESIVRGKCELAIAGGVNVSVHPNKYLFLSQGRFVSSKGRCESFGTGGDGYVPGEGVGAVLLKPLEKAIADGDNIYGVIKSTAINHGGKTNGYTVPNPKAQAGAISRAFSEAGIDARAISYLEAHGTGTSLGDPIEILGLCKAMNEYSTDAQFCSIGSVKSNIGHCESAAGIAGITKVLLQLKHRQVVPSLHSEILNTNIDFANSPFYVQQELADWKRPLLSGNGQPKEYPLCAGISSFGAGGANAHIIIEEYIPAVTVVSPVQNIKDTFPIRLSATDENRLIVQARQLLAAIGRDNKTYWNLSDDKLPAMAYTLQVGREQLECRLALPVTSLQELEEQLTRFINDPQTINEQHKEYDQPANAWMKGRTLQRISLPTYPFKKERYWIGNADEKPATVVVEQAALSRIHPLLHQNISDLSGQRFRIHFTGNEFYLKDHVVNERKILPAVAQLEMARTAVWESVRSFNYQYQQIHLQQLVWTQPLVVDEQGLTVYIELNVDEQGLIHFDIYSQELEEMTTREIFSQGQAAIVATPAINSMGEIGIHHLQQLCNKRVMDKSACYDAIATTGLHYGTSLRGIEEVYIGDKKILARIALPTIVHHEQGQLLLHPGIMDPALQTTLFWDLANNGSDIKMFLPFAMETMEVYAPTTAVAWVLISSEQAATLGQRLLDIDILNEKGETCVRMKGVSFATPASNQALSPTRPLETVLLFPSWERKDIPTVTANKVFDRQVIISCGLPAIGNELAAAMPHAEVIAFDNNKVTDFNTTALQLFEKVKALLSEKKRVAVQVLIPVDGEGKVYAGVAGLLKTARKESPNFFFQLISVSEQEQAADIKKKIIDNISCLHDKEVRYRNGGREVLQWRIKEEALKEVNDLPWKEGGVYLITGGAGGLGLLFANEMVRKAKGITLVLTGRSSLDSRKRSELTALEQAGAKIDYRKVDITNQQAVKILIQSIRHEFGSLNGILHSAGVIRDNYLINKHTAEWKEVLAPKVDGIQYLDLASKEVVLDFFVLFSSVTGALGNAGQADYATANAFMDEYATYRNELVAGGLRHGHTLSVNWPLWKEGGMQVDQDTEHYLFDTFGMVPLSTVSGIASLYRALSSRQSRVMIIEGDRERIIEKIAVSDDPVPQQPAQVATASLVIDSNTEEAAILYFKKLLSAVIKLPVDKIRADTAMEEYGIDSVMVMKMTARLEKVFGALSKTLFFEYRNISELTRYFLQEHTEQLMDVLGLKVKEPLVTENKVALPGSNILPMRNRVNNLMKTPERKAGKDVDPLDIAIVGVSGKYPQAENLNEFWENLCQGKDCITEIPAGRWDYRTYFDADKTKKGKTYSKWGGFLKDVAAFDALFFNISPLEAELLDPQERLFLQCVQETMEDAGYNRQGLAGSEKGLPANIGVYVGVMYEEYQLFGVQESRKDHQVALFGNPSSIANRISYFYNFDGPSMAVDTMCSSSLTAIHLACQSIHNGECKAAIAGGVNISIHPNKYLLLAQGKFISGKGRCESFGIGGDGYVPAEGVGAVLLKPLAQALLDGDHVYGVIKATAVNHGGRTNGYTVPNPQAQAAVISKACKRSGIDPRTISYLEAHGTGTSLGDPIEITGLKKAYQEYTKDNHFCAIGSVKSNIGHSESAAGMAGLTKILLQLKHKLLVPSLHSDILNPHIDFDNSPFVVQQTLAPWQRPIIAVNGHTTEYLRRAGLSSFGAGGSNAHLIIEEFDEDLLPKHTLPVTATGDIQERVVILLSAKNEDRLREMAARLEKALVEEQFGDHDLPHIAFTLQVGREALEIRLAMIIQSVDELCHRLREFVQDESLADDVYYGKIERDNGAIEAFTADEDLREAVNKWMERKKFAKICTFWVKGLQVDWLSLYKTATGEKRMRRISLPAYPFAPERYWVPQAPENGQINHHTAVSVAQPSAETLFLQPWWKAQAVAATTTVQYTQHIIFFAGVETAATYLPAIKDAFREAQVNNLYDEYDNTGSSYQAYSLHLFHLLKDLLLARPKGKILIQVIVDATHETLTGVQALLKTAQQENPLITGQLIAIPQDIRREALVSIIKENSLSGESGAVKYIHQVRHELSWKEHSFSQRDLQPFWKEGGRYLITGGAGGLGLIFAKEIAQQLKKGTVILTGRSSVAGRASLLAPLQGGGVTVIYKQADIADPAAVTQLIQELQQEFGGLDGIIHSAGVTKDSFLIHKTEAEWQEVSSPKIAGLINLDNATKALPLDCFIVFSSIAGALGNPGQADYAAANAFMDEYVQYRNRMVAQQQRHGLTISLNWPLWKEGGMQVYKEVAAQLDQKTGMLPLDTNTALQAFYHAVGAGVDRLMILHGDKRKMQEHLLQAPLIKEVRAVNNTPSPAAGKPDKSTLRSVTIQQLKSLFGQVVKLSPERIDEREEFQAYGLNSVMIVQLNQLLEKIFGELSKTLFYEYQHLSSLTDYLVKDHEAACIQWGGFTVNPLVTPVEKEDDTVSIKQQQAANIPHQDVREPIAIIGMSGRYPMAPSLTAYWENLQAGKDCITEIPSDRWSMDDFFQPDKEKAIEGGKSYSKWGGFLEGFAQFDPLFFNISPREANTMDPQERIFLQACWQVFEDAGYTRERIAQQYNGNVGVFAGVTKTGFELYGPALNKIGESSQLRTSFSSVANRVSWHLNLHGPSMPIDTMCSSSLIAIHEACESILSGACAMAIAGGVNLYLHPLNYVGLCSQSFLAVDGKCRSFGEGGSGFVPGEGVGAVLLKRLSQAVADGDTIYAVVKGSGVNHGGKTSGYTVPNPMLQATLIRDAFDKAGVQARDVSYIEAHGTGTSLGDPIEITGLSKAFQQDTADTQFCAIGSVKSNIGHLEAAAGIAGITKIVLQMKHGLLAPSLHAEQLNTNINFNKTPFYVQRKLTAWEAKARPRVAGISSFGAGGSNAHVIIEEYIPNGKTGEPSINDKLNSIPAIILLSARNKSRLKEQATQLLTFINEPAFDTSYRNLLNIAYTLQTGREAMEERWGVKVDTVQELQQQLRDCIAGKEQQAPLDGSVHQLLSDWIKGNPVSWGDLYTSVKYTPYHPVRINLPAYPFEPATYWLPGLLLHAPQETPPATALPAKEWLFTTEEWTLQPQPAAIDWNKQLQHYAGKRICIVYSQEQEANQLIALLEKLEKAGGLEQSLVISKLSVQQISLQQLSNIKPELVLFLGPGKLTNASVQPVESDLQAVYQYTQCLMQAAWDERVHLYYFYETTDANTRLDATALSGLFRSAMKENAQHVWKSVQLHNVKDTAAKCQLIIKEWLSDDPDATRFTAIQYKEGQRFSKELVETSLPPAATPAFRKNGNYIIAGGMGYIGSSLLEELANKYQANLAILSRGPYDEERKQQCEKLRKAGANVYYHVCDITNMESLRQTYIRVKQELGTIHGVINLARKHDSKGIMSKTWESFYSVSQVKIQGTINLDTITQDENLDLFMLFASIGAYGARGDADYAFSVAFQNAFATWRNTLRKAGKRTGVAISQCWGPWEEDRLFPESRKKMKALGLDLINMAAAFPLIEASCYSPHSILGLCTIFDKEKVKEVLGMQSPEALIDTSVVITTAVVNGQQLTDTTNQYEQLIIQWEQQKRNGQVVPVELIQQAISVEEMEHMDMSLVERVYSLCFDNDSLPAFKPSTDGKAPADILPVLLKAAKEVLQTEDIEETKPLQHYGLDSILAMRLSTNIAKKLTIEVMPKWLIEFPTLLELSQHLAESQVQAII